MNAANTLKNHFNLRVRETNHGMVCHYDEGTCSWWAVSEGEASSCVDYENTENGYFMWCRDTTAYEIKNKDIDLYIESGGRDGRSWVSMEKGGIKIVPFSS